MALDLQRQALSLGLALLGGAGLGLLYDVFRPLRRRGGDTLWDLLFCLAAAAVCFLFAMRAESGALGTGELGLALAGMLLYFHALSPLTLPAFERTVRIIGAITEKTQVSAKKVPAKIKKLFQNSRE